MSRSETEAEDAREMVSVRPPTPPRTWNRAKISARFDRAAMLVLDAFAQAIRGCNCDILDVDRVNLRIRFAFAIDGQGSEHTCSFFLSGDRCSDLEIVSSGPNTENQFDLYYETIVREVSKYLMFANAPVPPPSPAPAPAAERDREDADRRDKERRRSKDHSADGIEMMMTTTMMIGISTDPGGDRNPARWQTDDTTTTMIAGSKDRGPKTMV